MNVIKDLYKNSKYYLFGTAPGLFELLVNLPVLSFFINNVLRSIGQVIFCNNPITGFFILIAALIDTNSQGPILYSLASIICSNLLILFISIKEKNIAQNGLHGFNSMLVGMALPIFLYHKIGGWTPNLRMIGAIILLPIFTVILGLILNKYFKKLDCVPFTLPFNIVLMIFLLEAERDSSIYFVNTQLIKPTMLEIGYISDTNTTKFEPEHFIEGIMNGISQVFLIMNPISGLIILIGMLFYSRISTLAAILGSFIGLSYGTIIGSLNINIKSGLWGYNSMLSCIAIGGIFTIPNFYTFIYSILCSIITTMLFGCFQTLFQPWGLPCATIPFCIGSIIFMSLRNLNIKGLYFVDFDNITSPEDHIKLHNDYIEISDEHNVSHKVLDLDEIELNTINNIENNQNNEINKNNLINENNINNI
jgi:urea transporter